MNQNNDDELRIIPAERVDTVALQDEAVRLQATERASGGTSIEVTGQKVSKVGRYVMALLVILMLSGVVYAVVRLMTPAQPVTDANGCVWDEVSALQAAQYANDAKKEYKVKTEHGKTYLLRECKEEAIK